MKRIPIIDFVRFGSILIVIAGHFFPRWFIQTIKSTTINHSILNFLNNGVYGVIYFFVVSGFLITQILTENSRDFSNVDLRSFYVKRAARILPLLSAVVFISYFLSQSQTLLDSRIQQYHVWDNASGFGWLFWFSIVTFNFNWYLIAHYAGVGFQWRIFWSLAVEEQFYFCYPFIIKSLRCRKNVFSFLTIVVLFALIFRYGAFLYNNGTLMQLGSFSAFDQIAIGGILFLFNEKFGYWFKARQKISLGIIMIGIASCCYLSCTTSVFNEKQLIYVPTLLATSCALVILGGLHVPALFSRVAQILSWPGKLSYGSYLWHTTIIFLLMPALFLLGGVWGSIFLISATTFFAFLSYKYFEVPINHWIRSRFNLKPSSSE